MLKAQHENHNTCEAKNSQTAQSLKYTLLHKLLNPKPFSQTTYALDLFCFTRS
jgi:hypothetical protein